eukprot:snap_masked-scaffold_28-processed-gene-4.43-mRNA-1 protein AED:1.00 eAED:1.00 QI:0/0/0/0/1/1/3/0/67
MLKNQFKSAYYKTYSRNRDVDCRHKMRTFRKRISKLTARHLDHTLKVNANNTLNSDYYSSYLTRKIH